jgi:hypothetical protein
MKLFDTNVMGIAAVIVYDRYIYPMNNIFIVAQRIR